MEIVNHYQYVREQGFYSGTYFIWVGKVLCSVGYDVYGDNNPHILFSCCVLSQPGYPMFPIGLDDPELDTREEVDHEVKYIDRVIPKFIDEKIIPIFVMMLDGK